MDRDRGYLRRQRKRKIKQRKEMIKSLSHNKYISGELQRSVKYDDIISGDRDGLLSKGDYGFVNGGISKKTNSRKGHASYRHSGTYGAANNYSRHDKQQIDSLECQLTEFGDIGKEDYNMVYGIFGGEYSDWYVLGYFTDYEDAEKYCAAFGNGEYYVKGLENLDGEEDLSKVKVVYRYEVAFHQPRYKDNTWEMARYLDYTCYLQSECEPNYVNTNFQRTWVKFQINIDKCDEKLAEKIAQDYFAELLAYGDGEVREENIKLMNEKFARR